MAALIDEEEPERVSGVSQRTMNQVLPGYQNLSKDDKETMLTLYRNCLNKRYASRLHDQYAQEWNTAVRYLQVRGRVGYGATLF